MKFTVPVQSIISPLLQVAGICTSNPSNPDDLSQFLLVEVKHDCVIFTGTDNAVQLQAVVPLAEGSCESEGVFMIDAHKAIDFFKTLGNEDDLSLELVEDDDSIRITSSQANYTMRVRQLTNDKTFPLFAVQEDGEPKIFKIEEQKLRYMFEKSTFCVSHDNYRDYLKGVRFEIKESDISLFALDGHRMAALEAQLPEPVDGEINILMTFRGVAELQKLLSTSPEHILTMSVTNRFVSTKVGCYTLTNQLLNTKYPNVRSVIPKDCYPEIAVSLADLKTYVRRVSLFSNKRMNHINLTFTQNKLDLFSQNSEHEVGKASLEIDFPDPEGFREINLNADYLKDFLQAIDTTEVVFGFAPPYQNTLLRPREEVNEMGVRLRYVVSHIMV